MARETSARSAITSGKSNSGRSAKTAAPVSSRGAGSEWTEPSSRFTRTGAVNFTPGHTRESLAKEFAAVRTAQAKKQLATWNPLGLPQRFWERMLATAGIAPAVQWAGVAGAALGALAAQLTGAEFTVVGKSMNKEEFVTCGGVRLREVEFQTMESKLCPGLHFAGEILDLDGITGGYNFQAAWTTGWLAGQAMATPGTR